MESIEDKVTEAESEPTPGLYFGKTRTDWHKYWQREVQAEHKRNREWRRQADQIVRRYVDKRKDQGPHYNIGTAEFRVNLFHSNTFTLMSYLYGRVPTADVSRRFADSQDDVARTAANILQRMLNTSIETDGGDFTSVLRGNLEDYLVPGMGVARVRYEYGTETIEHEAVTGEDGEVYAEGYEEERLTFEDAPVDYVHWRDFHWGYGRMWSDVPWIAYDLYMNRTQARERFGPEIARKLTYKKQETLAEGENVENRDMQDPEETAEVKEIWSKTHGLVFWYHDPCDMVLDIQEDPLELPGFYPTPCPMVANNTTTLFYPTPFFILAQDLYNEIDQLSTRINIITNAVKVVGAYDQSFSELKQMLQSSIENDLVPVDKWAMLAEKGGMKGVIEMFPVGEIVEVLSTLRQMRLETIDLLYQVTGLSDILRGGGEKYEGVGKAELKARFGSVRITFLQEEFSRHASDLLTIKAQVIAKHFEPQTIVEQSNIMFSYDQQYVQPAIALIKNLDASVWRVDIKPETMAMVDWAQLKADRTEYINAVSLFLQSSAPILELQPDTAPMLLELLKWGLAGFKGGQEIESVLDQAIQGYLQSQQARQQQQQENPEMAKARGDIQKTQAKLRADLIKQGDKHRKELQKLAATTQADLEKIKADTQSDVIKEVVQANQNIREKRATAK